MTQANSMKRTPKFTIIVLGAGGGIYEDNLSAYLLAPYNSVNYVSLDAGTVLVGIRKAIAQGSFNDIQPPETADISLEGWILQKNIKAHLISHTHLDHVAGLVLNAPDGSEKEILGVTQTIDHLRDHFFNWKVWPNFSNEGDGHQLNKYRYVRLKFDRDYKINNTRMTVRAFPLSHGGYPSTAFLVGANNYYVLYLGDTAADAIEKTENIQHIWNYVSPLVQQRRLCGIFMEASFPNQQPDDQLYGHMTPSWMLHELNRLAEQNQSLRRQQPLACLSVIVTHIKSTFEKNANVNQTIIRQLAQLNHLGINFIIPEQGQRFDL